MTPSSSVSPAAPAVGSKGLTSSPQPKASLFSPQQRNDREVRISADDSLDIFGSILNIAVGHDGNREHFFVHEKPLTSRSEFFKRAVKEEWLHHKNGREIMLPEDDPAVFRKYATLSYTGLLTTKELPDEWDWLVRIYVLTEKLQDTWAKDRIIDAMHSFVIEHLPRNPTRGSQLDDRISAATLANLYNGTPTGSPARKLVVDLFADNGTESWLRSGYDLLPPDFLFEVTVHLLQKRPYPVFGNMLDRPSSHYHEQFEDRREPAGKIGPKAQGPETRVPPPVGTAKTTEVRSTPPAPFTFA